MKSTILGLFLALFSTTALAIPQAPIIDLDAPLEILPERQDFDFNGIVALNNCSASLVHFAGQPKTSKAYVLTNGHCLGGFWGGFPKPGEVRYKVQDSRKMKAFIDVNTKVGVRSQQLVYGTMTNTDAAIFRLTETYEQLEQRGVYSLEMSSTPPIIGDDIQIISGYWRKGFECSVEKIINTLKESDWTMHDSIRYSESGCEVYGGTSGSPVVAKGERLVVAVNNTGNESGQQCTMNNPCEVNQQGDVTVLKGRGYAQQTYWFTTCLNNEFDIDLDVEGCMLPKP